MKAIEAIRDLVICVFPSELGFGSLFRWSEGSRAKELNMFEKAHGGAELILR
jgi:hypothetical protein